MTYNQFLLSKLSSQKNVLAKTETSCPKGVKTVFPYTKSGPVKIYHMEESLRLWIWIWEGMNKNETAARHDTVKLRLVEFLGEQVSFPEGGSGTWQTFEIELAGNVSGSTIDCTMPLYKYSGQVHLLLRQNLFSDMQSPIPCSRPLEQPGVAPGGQPEEQVLPRRNARKGKSLKFSLKPATEVLWSGTASKELFLPLLYLVMEPPGRCQATHRL